MRILHIIATLDRQAGGPSNSVRAIVAAYPGIGSVGEVLTLDDPAAPFLREVDFKVSALGPVSTRFGYSRRLVPWLRAERHRFDGVVVHGLWQYLGWAVRRAVHPHKPYLVFTHGMLDPWFKRAYPLKHLKKLPYWLLSEYWVLRNADRVLFTSEDEARDARRSFWPCRWNAKVVPYGATAPEGSPADLRNAFLDRFPALIDADGGPRRFILFLGRIHPKKGCDLLLDAFSRIAAKDPALHLVFAGPDTIGSSKTRRTESNDGSSLSGAQGSSPQEFIGLRDKLASLAEDRGIGPRVHFTGMLDGDEKWGAFHACEAFSLPSHQENFGIAVAEALACGKPVLLSDKVNIWEAIALDGAALVGPDTPAGTLDTLERWVALPLEHKLAMGEAAVRCFRRRFDMQANANGILALFAEAVSRQTT